MLNNESFRDNLLMKERNTGSTTGNECASSLLNNGVHNHMTS